MVSVRCDITDALRASREAYAVFESTEYQKWATECNNDRLDLKPELYPEEYWQYLPMRVKEVTRSVYAKYPEARLKVIIARVPKIDISEEDEQRKKESLYIRALCYARLDAFFVLDEENLTHIPGYEFTMEIRDEHIPLTTIPRGYSIEE